MMRGMVIDMNDEQLHTMAKLQVFLDGTVAVNFAMADKARYDFIARTVQRFGYGRLKRAEKGVVLCFLERVSGYSRQQLTRLVKRSCEHRRLAKRYRASRTSFVRTYTRADVLLLADTNTLHGTVSGLATKKLMERAYGVFGDARYERLATVSVAHLYNRASAPGISVTARSGPRHGRCPFPSANAARQPRTTSPSTYAWTAPINWQGSGMSIDLFYGGS